MKTSLPKLSLALLLAASVGSIGNAGAVEYNTVQSAQTRVSFTYKQMNVPVDGAFRQAAVRLAFDPAKPQAASAGIDLTIASIDAGSPEANDEVLGKLWFNAKAYPTASFVSSSVKALGGNRYQVSGKLTIKGRSQDVSAPFTMSTQGGNASFDGSFTLKRADFAIGEGLWADFGTVANEIQIKFHVVASAANPAGKK